MNISVIVPCYRSRATLGDLVRRIGDMARAQHLNYEVILVVDGSPDDTYAVARRLERADREHVRAVLLRRNYGQHNALLAGIARARNDVIVTMDDDLQHQPEDVPALLAALEDPLVDLVYGVSDREEHGLLRSLASTSVKLALSAAGVKGARDVSAFRAFRAELRDGFAHVGDTFVSLDVVLSWTTTGVRRVTVHMPKRASGKSNYSFTKLVGHAMGMILGYGTMPLRAVAWLGMACGVLGVALLSLVLYRYFSGATSVAGFTTLASMIAIFAGAQMVSIGVLGEYIGRLHSRSMQQPSYVVRVDGRHDGPRVGLPTVGLPDARVHEDPDRVAEAVEERWRDPEEPR